MGYPTGHYTNAGLLFFVAVGCILLRFYYARLNRHLSKKLHEDSGSVRLYKY